MADFIIQVDGLDVREIDLKDPSPYQLIQYAYDFARENCISAKGVKIIRK